MTSPRGLMGVGMPAQLAKRVGTPSGPTESALTLTGTSQATAAAIGQFQFYVRTVGTTGTAVGAILPNTAEIGSEYMVVNATTSLVVWPPLNGQLLISGGLTATGVSVAVGKGALFVAITASTFDAWLSA